MWSSSPALFSLAASMTEDTRNIGASQHIPNNPQGFSGLKPAMQTWVSLANGQRAAVKGEGNVYVPEIGDMLYNVLYVPAFDHNLLSISSKTEVLQQFRQWLTLVERWYGYKGCQLQTDRGTEFMSDKFQRWLSSLGIRHRQTNPYSPAEN
ncbi:hypothetical protein E2320_006076 [Naja naja]|nr:hypothetical protein E2320_006076 [Naja naja]